MTGTALAANAARSIRGRPATLSCVIPCHNEARNLDQLLPILVGVLAGCADAWEVILVDDGSTDRTLEHALRWAEDPGFRCIQLSRNFGKEAALTAGLQEATGEVVVMMDADLQHPPALIPEFLLQWKAGADVAYAQRLNRDDESRVKRLGARGFYALLNAKDGISVPTGAGDFRLMDRVVVDALLALPERNRFMKGLYAWVGFRAVAVPYVPAPRAHGQSSFDLLRLIGLSLDGLTAFTHWPLRAVSVFGALLAMLSFLYGGYLSVTYLLYGHEVSGWTTIVVSLMLFAGIQLISLGVVGEYVGRIFEEVKQRPLYVVRSRTGKGLNEARP
nr:glycosyltransferase family 2 protein [uncultured Albidiferax sp.]